MKDEQVINVNDTEIEVTEITLLSVEEYEAAKDNIPPLNEYWWLRSPGFYSNIAACVAPDGGVHDIGDYVNAGSVGVRPALRVNPQSLNLQIGEKAQYGGHTFTRITEDMLLCDEFICKMTFRKDWQADNANDYEASDVKTFLDKWLEKAQQITDWIPISEALPKKNCETWVTIKNGNTRYVTAARFWVSERSWDIPGHNNITAWMPKPAPYYG